jgi:hypothetical protein
MITEDGTNSGFRNVVGKIHLAHRAKTPKPKKASVKLHICGLRKIAAS